MPPLSEPISIVQVRTEGGLDHAISRSRKGLSTKIYAIVDALVYPFAVNHTCGQVEDITQAETSALNPENFGREINMTFGVPIMEALAHLG